MSWRDSNRCKPLGDAFQLTPIDEHTDAILIDTYRCAGGNNHGQYFIISRTGKCEVLLRLSYLSPEIVRPVLAGRHPVGLIPTRLIQLSKNVPHDWPEQSPALGFLPG